MQIDKFIQGLFILILLVSGCKENISYEKSVNALHIDIENIGEKVIDTTLLADVRYIPLETTDESTIGNIDKVLYCMGKFYVLDKKMSKAVFIFSSDGTFLTKIHELGKGPGEYQYITDFDIDLSGNIYIYDHQLGKIIKYDINGKFLRDYSAIHNAEQMAVYDSSNIIFNQVAFENDKICQLVSYNMLEKEKTILLEARDLFDTDSRIPDFTFQRLMKYKKNLYYAAPFSNTVFNIDPDKIAIAAEIVPQELVMDKETLKNVLENKLDFSDLSMICQIINFYETKDYIHIWFKQGVFYDIFYSKKSNKYIYADNYNYKLGFPLSNIIGATEDKYIAKIDPIFLHRMNMNHSADLPKELRDKGLDSNPVIILYTLKPF